MLFPANHKVFPANYDVYFCGEDLPRGDEKWYLDGYKPLDTFNTNVVYVGILIFPYMTA